MEPRCHVACSSEGSYAPTAALDQSVHEKIQTILAALQRFDLNNQVRRSLFKLQGIPGLRQFQSPQQFD